MNIIGPFCNISEALKFEYYNLDQTSNPAKISHILVNILSELSAFKVQYLKQIIDSADRSVVGRSEEVRLIPAVCYKKFYESRKFISLVEHVLNILPS